ncbi:DUF3995 domain-containing protein [Phycicoccus sp. DTK01]|uniref:DUF3995 domain-containing protein n=1 Tax=Phycicoccus sp. DTK01 TaxID=2785745 RepID=UPI001A8C95B9|nr:DUF3995 domain-containing protein [Phycicoccus sp. DTK01]GIL36095.1 hypothetical protein PDTK01_21700 [Phycicoccus sp. DTK01]
MPLRPSVPPALLLAAGLGTVHATSSPAWAAGSPVLVAVALVLYGLANTVAANLALTGALGPVEDLVAVRGHAWLWAPLFLAWGLALGAGLRGARRRRPTPEGADRRRGVPVVSRG